VILITPPPARLNRATFRRQQAWTTRQRRKRALDKIHDELAATGGTREHRLIEALVRSRRLTERETQSRRLVAEQVDDLIDWWVAYALGEIEAPPGW